MQHVTVGAEEQGCRIDRIVRKRCALLSLSAIYTLFRKGKIRVDGKKIKQNYRLQEGEQLQIDVNEAEMVVPQTPDNGLVQLTKTSFFKKNLFIIYEDEYLLACNKPSGLVVHPGTGHTRHDTLIDCATAYLLEKKAIPSGDEIALVHRLDRDTSGVILIAKNKRTVRKLHEAFQNHTVNKEYRALCHHRPPEYEGTIAVSLSRTHNQNSGMKMRVASKGQEAKSSYRILEFRNERSSIAITLETGKTHQIRVQMAHVNAPIIGDVRYGDPVRDARVLKNALSRLYLHAHKLSLKHPYTGKSLTLIAPIPKEFLQLME
jgi:RluA family pseudouridine synthase